MLILNISKIPQGHSQESVETEPSELDLVDREEFSRTVHIQYDFNRVGNDVFIKSRVSTVADLVCDRCLDSYKMPLDEKFDLILTQDKNLGQDSEEDIYFYEGDAAKVEVTDSFRETLALAIPFKKLCKEDCKGLCPTCGVNWNHEKCNCDNSKIDPRWEALKDISFKE